MCRRYRAKVGSDATAVPRERLTEANKRRPDRAIGLKSRRRHRLAGPHHGIILVSATISTFTHINARDGAGLGVKG